jgi:hypothetical protein
VIKKLIIYIYIMEHTNYISIINSTDCTTIYESIKFLFPTFKRLVDRSCSKSFIESMTYYDDDLNKSGEKFLKHLHHIINKHRELNDNYCDRLFDSLKLNSCSYLNSSFSDHKIRVKIIDSNFNRLTNKLVRERLILYQEHLIVLQENKRKADMDELLCVKKRKIDK